MANYPIYRLVKGSTLTFTEMDDNLRWLSANMSASVVTITGSTYVAGNLNVSDGITGSLFGTASWAISSSYTDNAISSSYPIAVTGSSIYSTGPAAGIPTSFSKTHGIFLGFNAGFETIDAAYSIFLGESSGYKAREAYGSAFLLNAAGYSASFANNSFFVGYNAGYFATYANNSNFIGTYSGYLSPYASFSNFIGDAAGEEAYSSSYSNFIGVQAGASARSSSYSTLIGYKAGSRGSVNPTNGIGSNNIIIGTNITLPNNAANSINIGGLLFGTGSHSNPSGLNPFSGSANGRIGINQPTPLFNLDVSGSGRYTNGLTVTGSITGSNALLTGTLIVQTIVAQTITSSTDFVTGSTRFGSLVSNTHQFTGSVLAPSITGSLQGTSSWAVSASWAPSSPAVATISSYIATGSVTASVNTDISASFRVTSGSNTLLNVTKDGFVWIGNGSFTNQAYQLDVIGTARIKTDLYVHNSSGEARLEVGRSSIAPRVVLYGDDGSSGLVYYSSSFSNYIYDYNASTNNLSFQTNGSTRLRINSTGFATFLNGLSVTGSLLAPSITGSLQGTSSWAVSASWAPSSPAVATISSYIATGSITASVNADPTASFKVTSGSRTLLTLTNDAKVVIGTPGEFIDYQLEVSGAIKANGNVVVDSHQTIASSLYGTGQLLTGSAEQPVVYLESTWDTSANARGIEYVVTNTTSGASSKLLNLKVDSISMFNVSKAGAITTAAPSGYTAQPWKLGDATAGTLTPDTYITIEINGQVYSIPALLGTP
jgi:hypothetical protein